MPTASGRVFYLLISAVTLVLVATHEQLSNRLCAAQPASVVVDADFPGGNVVLEAIEGDRILLHQDLRDTAGDWFYWYFRVKGAAGRTITVQFTRGNVIGVRGPAASFDEGQSWHWLGADSVRQNSFRCSIPAGTSEARFSFGIPYLESNLREFLQRHAQSSALRVKTLCRSSRGRDIEMIQAGRLDGQAEHRILLTARHHACEALASYALEGILDTVLSDPADGAWLRTNAEFLAIPFMDKDGVEDGDQGKNRKPHDHNRDYLQRIHPAVKALTAAVPDWSQDKLRLAIDLHCPHIRGAHNEVIYFVGGPDVENWNRVTQFAQILEKLRQGPLPYRVSDNLPFGQAWNTGTGDPKLQSFSQWAAKLPKIQVASTIEIPYANASGTEVTADAARAFGRDVARAMRAWLDR